MANSAVLLRPDELWNTASKLQGIVAKPLPAATTGNPFIQNAIVPGNLAEISGRRSSGKTSLCWHLLGQATARGEVCAVVDLHDSFYPASAQSAGVILEQIVWVRCQREAQHAMRAADLLLHSGGFGVVLLDLCEASPKALNRIPMSYWYRLRRAVEHTPTILIVCTDASEVKCSFVRKISLKRKAEHWIGSTPFLIFNGVETIAILSKALSVPPEHLFFSSVV